MSDGNSSATNFLLAAILFVMLFGASAFLTGLAWVAAIGAALAVILIIGAIIISIVRGTISEVATAKAKQGPWIWLIFGIAGGIANAIVFFLACLEWLSGNSKFQDVLETIPYWYGPPILLLIGVAILCAESFGGWGPQVPAAVGSFFRGWLYWIGSPVLAPIGHWRKMKQDRATGQHVGIISAGVSLTWVFVLSLFFCLLAIVVPLLIITAIIANL